MHLFNLFPCIQSLCDLGIISPRELPVESFLHNACFFGCLADLWLALHALVPLRFFLSLSLSSSPHNPHSLLMGLSLDHNVKDVLADAGRYRLVHNPEESVVLLDETSEMISCGWSNPTPWHTPRECSEEELERRIAQLMAQVKH